MNTLLVSRLRKPEFEKLAIAARNAGWHVQWLHRRQAPKRLVGDAFALCAEMDTALRIARRHDLALIEPTFDLLCKMPYRFRQRNMAYMTLGDALRVPDRAFFKPADCTYKAFDAAVCEAGKYIFCADDLSRDTPVLVSEAVRWEVEYRMFVLNRRVATFSPYIFDGWLAKNRDEEWVYPEDEAREALAFCRELLADQSIALPPAVTLDVGKIAGRGWAVVEFNPVWCSGLLGCNFENVLPVLQRGCVRKENLTASDRQWMIDRPNTPRE